jgi:REP element-mobilizing transposase RayT
MARALRIEFDGAYYHVISRGQRGDPIFLEDRDRERFLELLGEMSEKHGVRVHGYVLMGNHYHLLISTPRGNLVKAMKGLNTGFANWFKAKHKFVGGILQGRYKAVLVDGDSYLAQVSAYIHLNPVRAKMAQRAEDYAWSSYKYYLGKRSKPLWLVLGEVLGLFGGKGGRYRRYVDQWMKEAVLSPLEIYGVRGILGKEDFIKRALKTVRERLQGTSVREVPAVKGLDRVGVEEIKGIIKKMGPKGKGDLFEKRKGNVWRKLLVYGLKRHTDLGLKEIGELLGMEYAAVGQAHSRFCREAGEPGEAGVLREKLDGEVRRNRKG